MPIRSFHATCHCFIVTLHAKISGVVYCYRSCLWRAACVCWCVCVCGSVTTITRNCVHRSSTGLVGKGSDHLQLIKFWRSRAPGKGVCGGAKKFGSALLQPVRSVCVSLSAFFIIIIILLSPDQITRKCMFTVLPGQCAYADRPKLPKLKNYRGRIAQNRRPLRCQYVLQHLQFNQKLSTTLQTGVAQRHIFADWII